MINQNQNSGSKMVNNQKKEGKEGQQEITSSREQEIARLRRLKSELIKAQSKDSFNNTNEARQNLSNSSKTNKQVSKSLEKGRQKTLGTYPKNHSTSQKNGFVDRLMLALLGGFVLGVVCTVGYLVLNMGKYTFIFR